MQKLYDVVIIGAGPAGLTAAIYAARGAASTLVVAGEKWGGQLMLTTQVENFPGFPKGVLGPDLMLKMRRQAEALGAEFLENNITAVDFKVRPFHLSSKSQLLKTKTVIIATGALTAWLGVPGEKELIGRGVSTCAPCDAPFFKGKVVAVVGGGDTAMEEASILTKYVSKVYLIHRRDTFRASAATQNKVTKNPKIEIIWNTEVLRVEGKSRVESLELKNNNTNKTSELKVDGVFIAIGHRPDSDIFKGQVEMDNRGFITNNHMGRHTATSVPGVYVAGDVADSHYKQAITAAGCGCMAAMDAIFYLTEIALDK